MDAGQSSQTGALSSSPGRRTHTLTVREYEETIQELKTENFDLKLQLYMQEENLKKNCCKDGSAPDKDPVEVIVTLNSETEALQKELQLKDELLQNALKRTKKYEIDFKELKQKNAKFQAELSSLSELPSKEEFLNLLEEKENLLKRVEILETALTEKEQEIHDLNQKIEIIAEQNEELDIKLKKRNLVIQDFVHKNYEEKDLFPEELKKLVISATQAARNQSKDEMRLAMKNIGASLNQIMCSATKITLDKSMEKENIESPRTKCLKEEFLERSSVMLPTQIESSTEISRIHSLKEVLAERNTSISKEFHNLDSFVHGSCTERRAVGEIAVNIAERDIIDHLNFSAVPSKSELDLISFSNRLSPQSCSIIEPNSVTVKTLSTSSDLIPEKEDISKSGKRVLDKSSEEASQLVNLLKENENLKLELEERLVFINELQSTCKELELQGMQLKETRTDASKASKQHSVYTQTNITGHNLFDEMAKLQKDPQLSNNVDELKEDVLLLLLAIDGKNEELIDVKQSLSDVKEDLKKALNATNSFDKDFYMHERNDLHERLAFSCSVNEELMGHLKNLKAFMKNLLQNKFENSIDSTKENSDFISDVSECLNKSLKLSNVLSDHLSVCEGSRLFEECESFLYKNGSYFEDKSFPHLNLSQLNIPEQSSVSYSGKLLQIQEAHSLFMRKSDYIMKTESEDSQLCWRCWQQLNPPMSKPDISHPVQKYAVPNDLNYLSSESDIWSEPDRNISMQRIGISLQNSPVMSKSPRKQRLKDKRLLSRLSTDQETSSTDSQRLSKKRHGSASRRLFAKENVKNQDTISENFYILLTEKYPKLQSLLIELQDSDDERSSSDIQVKLTAAVASIGGALHELHTARENAKNFPSAVCGKCVMLELFANLKLSLKEVDFHADVSTSEQEILQEFLREINLLKDECKEPLSLVLESIGESDKLSDDIKIRDMEDANIKLISKNKELSHYIDDIKSDLSRKKKVLESLKTENSLLTTQVNSFKKEMVNIKEKELSQKNEELVEELTRVNESYCKLSQTLNDLEEKNKESDITLNKITTELQNSKSDLVTMKEKCQQYEKELNQQMLQKEMYENQLKILKSRLLSEREKYLNQIEMLKVGKTSHVKEKEFSQKNEELPCVNENYSKFSKTLNDLEEKNEESNTELNKITTELQKTKSDLVKMKEKCLEYEKELSQQILQKEGYENQLKTLESKLMNEQKEHLHQIEKLRVETTSYIKEKEKELSQTNEELARVNESNYKLSQTLSDLEEKNKESNILLNEIRTELQTNKSDLVKMNEKCLEYERELNQQFLQKEGYEDQLKNLESRLLSEREKYLNQIEMLKVGKTSHVKEKEFSQKNEDLPCVNENYSKFSQTLNDLEEKNEESNTELNKITTELQKTKSDLVKMKGKCLEYEKELSQQILQKEGYENQLKTFESKLLNEQKEHLHQIEKLRVETTSHIKEKEKELSQTNEELARVNESNYKLSQTLSDLEEKNKESNILLNEIRTELQTNKSDLVKMNEKCLEYERELNQQFLQKEGYEDQLKNLESKLLSEQEKYLHQIEKLKAKISSYVKDVKSLEDEKLDLEKINANTMNELKNLNGELLSLQGTIKELRNTNKALSTNCENLQIELKDATEHATSQEETMSLALKEKESEYHQQLRIQELKLLNEQKECKSDLVKMNDKCLEYERELNQQILQKEGYEDQLKTLESKLLSEQEKYLHQIEKLKAKISSYVKDVKSLEDEKLDLEKINANTKNELKNLNGELLSLQGTIKELRNTNKALSTNCENLQIELKDATEHATSQEETMSLALKEKESEYHQQLRIQELKLLNEQKELIGQTATLEKEKGELLQKLKKKKKYYEILTKEKEEIQQKYDEICKQISSLKLLNEELRNKQATLIQKNKFLEKALHSSNSECDTLNRDLRQMRETLQNLESKCLQYEKQLDTAAGIRDNFVECLLNIINELSNQRQKLNKICKTYQNENYILWDDTSELIPVRDENNVQELCEKMSSESKKLIQSVDMLLGLLKLCHSKSLDSKTGKEMCDVSTQKQTQIHETEVDHWQSQYDQLQKVIDGLQKSVSEKEKSVQFSAYEIQSLKDKLYNTEKEIEKANKLLKDKNDEITTLQERIFDLQTYLNSITSDKTKSPDKTSSFDKTSMINNDFISPKNQLPSQPSLKVSKMCQTSEQDVRCQSTDDSFSSASNWNSCCEKYYKKNHSLQKKLSLCNKRIELLEKEKNDLRESCLHQLQIKRESLGKNDSIDAKLTELESKLEQKKTFINELKGELLDACNSLIDKEKQVDDLKQKLSEYEAKSQLATLDVPGKHSIVPLESVDSNIKTLRSYKWRLLQTLFDIQRQFYEKRGIHLNYFERFRDHVNNLYTTHLAQSLSKSESMPSLGSHTKELKNKLEDDRVKNLVNLEVDIECLENLKIFLNRFFVPCVLDTPQTSDSKTSELKEENEHRSLTVQTEAEILRNSKHEIANISNIVFPNLVTAFESSDHQDASQEKTFSFENFASNVSQHLDCIEKFFTVVKKSQVLESFDTSAQECTSKTEVKSLLLKIFQEIKARELEIVTIFDLNSLLKKYDFVVAPPIQISSSKPDVSDRESVMSEETIAVSRCESPLSFEEVCPIKISHPEMSKLEERILKPESVENRVSIVEPFGTKVTAIGSSCDSVCHRSSYSSPDLGIESDPNHDSSAPEQKEDGIHRYQKQFFEENSFLSKSLQKTAFTSTDSAGRWSGHKFGETLYAIGNLKHYELLKKEVKESLVAIKSVLSRTGDGLHHIAKYTSPRKTLEYNTLKSIKDSCVHIEVCLRASNELVGKFWTAPCPTENEWKLLNDENQSLVEQLQNLKFMIQKQENEFKKAMGKLENAQQVKAHMEKKISKKLVQTKKVIRQAELKLLQNRCQNFPPVPKYPSDQSEQ